RIIDTSLFEWSPNKIHASKLLLFNKKIKLIVIADTHGCLKEDELVDFLLNNNSFDACILLGDHSNKDVSIILNHIDKNSIYALLGNHDANYIEEFDFKNLNGNIFTINSISIMGIQGSFRYKNEKFPSFSQKESIEFLNPKEKVDILFSHDAPFQLCGINDNAHQGLFGITYYLYKNRIPYCIHGHVHIPYEKYLLNDTKVTCCYMLNYIEL
nr:metallophosphoesterase family protein [Clostridia bacterium]